MGLPQCQIQLEHQVQLWQCQNRAQGRSRTTQSPAGTFETGPPPEFQHYHSHHRYVKFDKILCPVKDFHLRLCQLTEVVSNSVRAAASA